MLRHWLEPLRATVDRVMSLRGLRHSQARLARDAAAYWTNSQSRRHNHNSHWRGAGPFADDERWLSIGRESLAIYHDFARMLDFRRPVSSMAEWGCGGGANAIHFAREAERFYGIDISPDSLGECGRQMLAAGLGNFTPVLIDVDCPEAARDAINEPIDLLLCLYVFELLPSPEYGRRVLQTCRALLRDDAMALVQIKYATTDPVTWSRRWGYRFGVTDMTTYPIEQFWELAESCGFEPLAVRLVPVQRTVDDVRYAYFALRSR